MPQSRLAGTVLRLGSAGSSIFPFSALLMTSAQNNFFSERKLFKVFTVMDAIDCRCRPLTSLAFGELYLGCQHDELYIRPKQDHKRKKIHHMVFNTSNPFFVFRV